MNSNDNVIEDKNCNNIYNQLKVLNIMNKQLYFTR